MSIVQQILCAADFRLPSRGERTKVTTCGGEVGYARVPSNNIVIVKCLDPVLSSDPDYQKPMKYFPGLSLTRSNYRTKNFSTHEELMVHHDVC
jgi:hypothetical protein